MRTWKQGAVGRIKAEDGTFIFFRCLKYPLARFYAKLDSSSAPEGWICDAHLDLSVLRHMERLAVLQVGRAEVNGKSPADGEGILTLESLYRRLKDT